MSDIKDGGPAFPMPSTPSDTNFVMPPHVGMSLRDYFAAKALLAIVPIFITGEKDDLIPEGSAGKPRGEWIARQCYLMADSMLTEREKL